MAFIDARDARQRTACRIEERQLLLQGHDQATIRIEGEGAGGWRYRHLRMGAAVRIHPVDQAAPAIHEPEQV